jgi:hypothetical protein
MIKIADEQLAALETGEIGGQEWAEHRHRESEQGHQQAGLRDGHFKVSGYRRQQADNDEFRGQHRESGGRQQKNGQQHGKLQQNDDTSVNPKARWQNLKMRMENLNRVFPS